MNRLYERGALTICAAAMVTIAATSLTSHAGAAVRNERYDEVTVRRLRVVDASGATRLLLTGKPIPEGTIGDQRLPRITRERTDAGIMFYNDRGDEQGGITYSGSKGEQSAALTFDAWQQDQALEIQHGDDPNGSDSFIAGNERPRTSMVDTAVAFQREAAVLQTDDERLALRRRYRAEGRFGYQRWQIGNSAGLSELKLNDAKGHPRLRLRVTADGDARVEFLDTGGNVVRSVTP